MDIAQETASSRNDAPNINKWLVPLAVATFAVGTDAYVIAGLLPNIAEGLEVSVAKAGQLVTVFALTFAIAAPVLGWLLSSLDRRTALQLALLVFAIGNVATALSPNYTVAMLSRVLAAIGAATITATASSAAVAIAPPERRGRAMAVVIGGLTVSTALGMPVGTLIGATDWRLTLWAVAGLSALAFVGVSVGLPKISVPSTSLAARLAPLRGASAVTILLATLLVMAGHYTLYTYIAAATADSTRSFTYALTLILLAWGIGAVVGNVIAGSMVDKLPPFPVAVVSLGAAAVLLAISPLAVGGALIIAIAWSAIWGITDGMPSVVQQYRLVALAPESAPVLFGLNSSAIFLGIALGGALGGAAQDWSWLSVSTLGIPAAILALIATLLTLATKPKSGSREERE
ncbi:MFS transporter [Dietzia timorensis]|uniref:MFS transporter n=1 Tax=Dietzia timorensis TaxID=499555 RepID=UPI000AD9346E|nr:MFS transporter [Dietzia timorensis]